MVLLEYVITISTITDMIMSEFLPRLLSYL